MVVPKPAARRLARLTVLIDELSQSNQVSISSSQLAKLSGFSAQTIRKDISYLGNPGNNGSGYDVNELLTFIREKLNLLEPVRAAIVGLGKLGSSLLNYQGFGHQGIEIVAGFDSSINKIEQLRSTIPLFPSYDIEDRVRELRIELGIIAVPAEVAQKTAERMRLGGIRGILNFSPATLNLDNDVSVRNFYFAEELMVLATEIRTKAKE